MERERAMICQPTIAGQSKIFFLHTCKLRVTIIKKINSNKQNKIIILLLYITPIL